MLRRLGNKKKLAPVLWALFPPHEVRYLPFFGAGGDFFAMPKAKYTWCNDSDSEVFNFFQVLMKQKTAFQKALKQMPLHEELFLFWKKNKETDSVLRALRFLMLSNFSLHGKMDTMQLLHSNIEGKQKLEQLIDQTSKELQRCFFRNQDFRDFFKSIYCSDQHIPFSKRFAYADPVYVGTTSNYENQDWMLEDFKDLVDTLLEIGGGELPFGISEFDTKEVVDYAESKNLHIKYLGERRNLMNRRTEIYISNYKIPETYQGHLF